MSTGEGSASELSPIHFVGQIADRKRQPARKDSSCSFKPQATCHQCFFFSICSKFCTSFLALIGDSEALIGIDVAQKIGDSRNIQSKWHNHWKAQITRLLAFGPEKCVWIRGFAANNLPQVCVGHLKHPGFFPHGAPGLGRVSTLEGLMPLQHQLLLAACAVLLPKQWHVSIHRRSKVKSLS